MQSILELTKEAVPEEFTKGIDVNQRPTSLPDGLSNPTKVEQLIQTILKSKKVMFFLMLPKTNEASARTAYNRCSHDHKEKFKLFLHNYEGKFLNGKQLIDLDEKIPSPLGNS